MEKNDIKNECFKSIDSIFNNYDNDLIFKRIKQYICHQMPIVINNFDNSLKEKRDLSTEHDYFVELFLNKNKYFYVSNTDKFFFYDGVSYNLFKEDDILYKILSSIREKRYLLPWKHKTKNNIMKRIKNNNLLDSIPESVTIQRVINLFINSRIFNSKEETKYFLTVIGDNILKKNNNLVHIIDNNSKDFLRELNNICCGFVGTGCTNTFKYKFHDHIFNNSRLININSIDEDIWLNIIMNNTIDILCVSCHYSNRFNGSDNFLIENNIDENITEHIFYLKYKTPESIVDEFINNYIEITIDADKIQSNIVINKDSEITQINIKDMQYLWRHFLNTNNLPNIIFQNNFKKIITDKLSSNFNSDCDSFIGLSSKHLPIIRLFLEYWNNTIVYNDSDNDYELEISEIVILFKKWSMDNYNSNISISDKKALDIINYFFPDINIEDNKYIYQINTDLWDKNSDIVCAYDAFKNEIIEKYGNNEKKISMYDFYNYYTNMFKHTKLIIGKHYFDKFFNYYYPNNIDDDNYLTIN
tara:strand:+ start:29672 stop:31258 length:1587 start_codon:yes stop_codon:yes gene_type:complete